MTLDRLWAGWRADYVGTAVGTAPGDGDDCVLCRVVADGSHVVWRGALVAVVLNAYPYTSGHVMVLPQRHQAELEALDADEAAELWSATLDAVRAVKASFGPHGLNVGANLGRAGGAGVPGHLHLHVVPRWHGDTNFMTSVAETRVLPEPLDATLHRLKAAWPA
ncbi:MAG TPA: HIT domain-containing protein [Acidimicrobiales bacterium]|nr:HIT domain-containing protein [Acidimicrobiales bacterium]